ncbi:hypothetical protein [Rickettsiella grylli]|nr:hypothetical protein [Rickettsiella grylli]
MPNPLINCCHLQRDKHTLIKNLNKLYTPICFDSLNINPYPLLFDKQLFSQLKDCHSLLIEVIPKIVSNFFIDPSLQQIIALDDKTLDLLHSLEDKPYEIGFIRPDFVLDKNYQIKICEINARFPLNAFVLSQCLSDEIFKKFEIELSFLNVNKIKNLDIFENFFDFKHSIHIIFNKEKSLDIFLLKTVGKKIFSNLKVELISSPKFLFKNKKKCVQMILNLHQQELLKLKPSLLNEIIQQTHFNDIRTIFIVHDKRFLSILSNRTIMSNYISLEKYNRLTSYIIPTYILNNDIIHNIKSSMKNWVLKKNTAGKGEGMIIGKEDHSTKMHDILSNKRLEYIAQPFVNQPFFRFLSDSSPITNNIFNKNYYNLYLVGTILSFNNIFLGPGLLRGSSKSIINIAQGDTTIFIPFSLNYNN